MNAQPRDRAGRFVGARLNCENTPAVPATVAAEVLRARRTVVLIWAAAPRLAEYVVTVEPPASSRPDCVRICAMGTAPIEARFIRIRRPDGSSVYSWWCPACCRRVKYLFTAGLRDHALTLTIGCRWCLRLRYTAQGGGSTKKALVRTLADIAAEDPLPRAVLVPAVVTSDLRALRRFKNLNVSEAPTSAVSGLIE